MFRVIPYVKLQNDKQQLNGEKYDEKLDEKRNNVFWLSVEACWHDNIVMLDCHEKQYHGRRKKQKQTCP